MKINYVTFIALAMVIVLFIGCEESIMTVSTGEYNLIKNSSFEKFFKPTLEGWTNYVDTPFVKFFCSAPQGGGFYSVGLVHSWTFPGRITYEIFPPTGTHRYKLSAWGKSIRDFPVIFAGRMSIFIKREDIIVFRKQVYFTDSLWTYGSLLDTITTDSIDTFLITLSGSPSYLSSGYVFFDLCKFVLLD